MVRITEVRKRRGGKRQQIHRASCRRVYVGWVAGIHAGIRHMWLNTACRLGRANGTGGGRRW